MRFHTNLPVYNIQASMDFYRVLFGSEPVKVKSDYAKFLPPGGGLNISFHQSDEGPKALKNMHVGFELPDMKALDEAHKRLEKAGLISQERSTEICCYANQDKFWVTDPNGYSWELYVLLADTEQKIAARTSCCAAAASGTPGCC